MKNNSLLNSQKSQTKFIFLLLIIISFFGVTDLAIETGFIKGLEKIYTHFWIIICLLICLFIQTIHFTSLYKKNYPFLIRQKNQKENLKILLKQLLIQNSILILISFFLTSTGLALKYFGFISFDGFPHALFVLIRFSIYLNLLNFFVAIIYWISNIKWTILTEIIIFIFIFICPIKVTPFNSFYFNFANYLLANPFTNEILEITCSIINVFLMTLVDHILFRLAFLKRNDVG